MPSKRPRFQWATSADAARDEGRYWRSVSIAERVSAVETIRRATPGIYGDTPARMERTYRFVILPPRPLPKDE
jgi:glycyl-tRNA synthetase alpha subunit